MTPLPVDPNREIIEQADSHVKHGNWDAAMALLSPLVTQAKPPAKALHLMTTCLLEKGEGSATDALFMAERAATLAPTSAQSHVLHSHALSRMGRYEDALKAADTAVRFGPHELDPLVRQCLAHLALGHSLDARGTAAALLEHHPLAPIAHECAARAALDHGDKEAAIGHVGDGLALDPSNPRLMALARRLSQAPEIPVDGAPTPGDQRLARGAAVRGWFAKRLGNDG